MFHNMIQKQTRSIVSPIRQHPRLHPLAAVMLAASVITSPTLQANTIEEVVVTAQKRAQSMQDVGIAVTAFTSDQLNELGVSQPIDIAGQTPGLEIKNTIGNSNPVITIRGVGLNDYNTNNSPSAAVHVDEVYLGSNGYLGFQLFDIEQVETHLFRELASQRNTTLDTCFTAATHDLDFESVIVRESKVNLNSSIARKIYSNKDGDAILLLKNNSITLTHEEHEILQQLINAEVLDAGLIASKLGRNKAVVFLKGLGGT